MYRIFTTLVLMTVAAVTANAQDDGLPMTDQLGSGIYGIGGGGSGGGYSRSTYSAPRPRTPVTPNRSTYRGTNGFRPVTPGISPQQMQDIANAAAALGPAIQQARQNLQQIRAQNGGYLIPRNNMNNFGGGLGGGRLINRIRNAGQQQANWQRYTDTFGVQDAQRVRQSLVNSGYNNVQIQQHPHNDWRRQRGLEPVYGVYYR